MRVVFAEGIKCGKDCGLYVFAHSNRSTIREERTPACYASCTIYCVSKGGLDKVYIKADMGERRKTLNIWLQRTQDRGGVEGSLQGSRPRT